MIVQIVRFAFVTAGALGGFAASRLIDWSDTTGLSQYTVIFILVLLGWSIGYVIGGIVGRELSMQFGRAEERLSDVAPTDIGLAALGVLTGMVVAWLASQPLRVIQPAWISALTSIALYVMLAYVGMRIALVKRRDIAVAFPRLAGVAGRGQTGRASLKLLDTSALIDGRVLELRRLGLPEGEIRVPRFVISELQTLADSADDVKRSRGRRGLDLLQRLQSELGEESIFEADFPDTAETDEKLLRLAKEVGAGIVTVDYNLTKVARVRGVEPLNLNEIATVLKPAFLPGEAMRVNVIREGKEPGQGVGYLDDGTMIVVQNGRDHIGETVDAEVMSVLQTSAGRMIFVRFSDVVGPGESDA